MRTFTTPQEAIGTILWKAVDEGWIRYDQRSGSTHLLSALAHFVIDLLEASSTPLSAADLLAALRRAEPDADPDECRAALDAVLERLAGGGLIHSAPRSEA